MNEENNQKNIEKMDNRDKLEFEKALELRNFEISNFWKRGWFFGALLIAIFTGYIKNKESSEFIYPVCISFVALCISFAQSLINRGSKYWQERWEYKTKNLESSLGIDLTKTEKFNKEERYYIDACIIDKEEFCQARAMRISVSKLAFLVWDIITISCFFIWINDVFSNFHLTNIYWGNTIKIFGFHSVICIYIFFFFCDGKMYEHLFKSKEDLEKDKNDHKINSRIHKDSRDYIDDKLTKTKNQ